MLNVPEETLFCKMPRARLLRIAEDPLNAVLALPVTRSNSPWCSRGPLCLHKCHANSDAAQQQQSLACKLLAVLPMKLPADHLES